MKDGRDATAVDREPLTRRAPVPSGVIPSPKTGRALVAAYGEG